jgi:hypothetical protein
MQWRDMFSSTQERSRSAPDTERVEAILTAYLFKRYAGKYSSSGSGLVSSIADVASMLKPQLVQRISVQKPQLYQRDVENTVNARP